MGQKLTKEEGRQSFIYSDVNDRNITGSLNIQCSGEYNGNGWNNDENKIANVEGYINVLTGMATASAEDLNGYFTHLYGRLTNIYGQLGKSNPLRYNDLRFSTDANGKQVNNPICPTVFWVNPNYGANGQADGTYVIVKDAIWNIYAYFCGNVGEVFLDLAIAFGHIAVESMDITVTASGGLFLKGLYQPRRAFCRPNETKEKKDSIMGFGQVSTETAMDAVSFIHSLSNNTASKNYNTGINKMYTYLFKAIRNMYGYDLNNMVNLWSSEDSVKRARCKQLHLALMEFDAGYNIVCHLGSLLTKLRDTLNSASCASMIQNAGLVQANFDGLPAKNNYFAGLGGSISKDMIIEVLCRYHGEMTCYTNKGMEITVPNEYVVNKKTGAAITLNFTRMKVALQYADMVAKSAIKMYNISLTGGGHTNGTMHSGVISDQSQFPRMAYIFGRRVGTENDAINSRPDISRAGRFCGVPIRWNVTPTTFDFAPYMYRALLGKTKAEGDKIAVGDKTDVGLPTTMKEYKRQSNEQKSAILNSLATSIANTKILQYKAWLDNNKNIFAQVTALDFMSSISSVNLAGIIGLPVRYSRLSDLDTRDYYNITNPGDSYSIKANIYGRNYAENTVLYGNMVSITPCRPKFMGNNDGKTVASLLSNMTPTSKDGNATAEDQAKLNASMQESLNKVQSEGEKGGGGPTLFTAEPAGAEYSRMVANALRSAALLFGITTTELKAMFDDNELDYVGKGTVNNPFDFYSAEKTGANIFTDIYNVQTKKASTGNTDGVAKLLSNMYSIVLYNSGMLESSESISNNVGPSFIDQLVNLPMSEIARDANFLMNKGGAYDENNDMISNMNKLSDSRNNTDATQAIKDGVGGVLGIVKSASSKMFGSIKLPKIWKGTEYSKTYNIKLKLTSPSPDYQSVFKYIMVELIRLMPLWSPQQWGYYQDTISSPFLVQVYNRGTMSIEMGMITGVEVNRNAETMGLNGLPTELDVNLTITDLFPYFSMPSKESDFNMSRYFASGFLSYISTFAGVPLYRGDVSGFMESKVQFFKSKVVATGNAPGKMVNDNISHWLYKISNTFR